MDQEQPELASAIRTGSARWLVVAILTILGLLLAELPLLPRIRDQAYQALQWSIHRPHKRVIVVAIDDAEYWRGKPSGIRPLNRQYLADLLKLVAASKPDVLAVDVGLQTPAPPHLIELEPNLGPTLDLLKEVDQIAQECPVVLPKTISGLQSPYHLEHDVYDTFPFSDGAEVTFGHTSTAKDIRQIPTRVRLDNNQLLDSFALAVLRATTRDDVPAHYEHPDHAWPYSMFLPERTFAPRKMPSTTALLTPAMLRAATPKQLRRWLRGQIVIVGGTWHKAPHAGAGIEYVDQSRTPIGPMPGVLAHANYIQSLLWTPMFPMASKWRISTEVLLSIGVLLIFMQFRGWNRALLILCTIGSVIILTWIFRTALGVFFDLVIPVTFLGIHTLWEEAGERWTFKRRQPVPQTRQRTTLVLSGVLASLIIALAAVEYGHAKNQLETEQRLQVADRPIPPFLLPQPHPPAVEVAQQPDAKNEINERRPPKTTPPVPDAPTPSPHSPQMKIAAPTDTRGARPNVTLPEQPAVAEHKPLLHPRPNIDLELAQLRERLVDDLNKMRASRLAAAQELDAALAREEWAIIASTTTEIEAATASVESLRAAVQEAERSEGIAQASAEREMSSLLSQWASTDGVSDWSATALETRDHLIADVSSRRAALDASIARRIDRDTAHGIKVAELRRRREETRTQDIAQAPTLPPTLRKSSIPTPATLRYTVVVDKFENKSESPRGLGEEWATLMTSSLHETGNFIVVAQDDMQLKALKEQLRGLSGATVQAKKTAVRGQMAPAQLLVKGVITHFKQEAANQGGGFGIGKLRINTGRKKTEIRATLQMIDASTGAIVAAKEFTGLTQARMFVLQDGEGSNASMDEDADVHAALMKAITAAIPWMVAQLPGVPWKGSVVKIVGDRVIINRGSREGVKAGDEFIAGESDVLRDPDTGEVLKEIVNGRARIRVIELSERTATCSIVTGDARQILPGMRIQYRRDKR